MKLSQARTRFFSLWNYGTSVARTSDNSNTLWQSLWVRATEVLMYFNSYIIKWMNFLYPRCTGRGDLLFYLCPSVRPSVLPSVQDIFHRIFLSNYWWQKSDIWSQASYRYAILWEVFLDPSDSYFPFADLVGFYTHWTYMRGYHKWALAHSSPCFSFAVFMN